MGSLWGWEVLNGGVSACDWGRAGDGQGRAMWPLGLPAVGPQGSLGVWPRQKGMTTYKWESGAGLLIWRDVPAAGFTRGAPFPFPPIFVIIPFSLSLLPSFSWQTRSSGPALPL